MPLLGASSYLPTLRSFLSHWEAVNAALPPGVPLVLGEQGALADGVALKGELEVRTDAVRGAVQDVVLARGQVVLARTALRGRLEQFGVMVRGYWNGTPWTALVPNLPPVDAALDRFLRPAREAVRLWTLLESEPAPAGVALPLMLGQAADFGRADFTAMAEALRLLGLALEEAEFAADVARARRDAVMLRVRAVLMNYARTLPGRLPTGNAVLEAMPRLWPLPGHTPEAVGAQGAWDAGANGARLSWEASAEKTLSHFEIRGCAGPDYEKKDETVLGRVAGDAPREFATGALLEAPGAVACFRVYVVLETGNERGSGPVVVARP